MSRDAYHVFPAFNGGWAVKKDGAIRASARFDTKEAAIDKAREMSRRHETILYIHKRDGQISDRHSYGNDPRAIKR